MSLFGSLLSIREHIVILDPSPFHVTIGSGVGRERHQQRPLSPASSFIKGTSKAHRVVVSCLKGLGRRSSPARRLVFEIHQDLLSGFLTLIHNTQFPI